MKEKKIFIDYEARSEMNVRDRKIYQKDQKKSKNKKKRNHSSSSEDYSDNISSTL